MLLWSMQMWRHLVSEGFLLLVFAGTALACGRVRQSSSGVAVPAGGQARQGEPIVAEAPDVQLRGVAFVRLSEGRVVARGTAQSASYRRSGGKLLAHQGAVVLAPGAQAPEGLGAVHLDAPIGEFDLASRTGSLWQGVHVRTDRGDTATTERVFVDGAAGLTRAPGPVEAQGPGYTVHGQSLVARSDGSRLQLSGGVEGTLTPQPQQQPAAPATAKARGGRPRKAAPRPKADGTPR